MKLNSGFTPEEVKRMLATIADEYNEPTWALEYIAQLEAETEALMMAANSFLGLIDCLGGRGSLDDAGPDGKNLAELCDYPDYMNKKIALLADTQERE